MKTAALAPPAPLAAPASALPRCVCPQAQCQPKPTAKGEAAKVAAATAEKNAKELTRKADDLKAKARSAKAAARAYKASQVAAARAKRKKPSSKHRGVSWNKGERKWVAKIGVGGGKRQYLGGFEDEDWTTEGSASAGAPTKKKEFVKRLS